MSAAVCPKCRGRTGGTRCHHCGADLVASDAPPEHKPPATVTLRWCPECGRDGQRGIDDLHSRGMGGLDSHLGPCPGFVRTLTYVLQAEPRTREEMIEAGAKALATKVLGDPGEYGTRWFAEHAAIALIAAGVIDPEPRPEKGEQR